ncbi:thiamine pyrophosphate-binding protein [Winslowiella toletana]|uniref:thiamine pyrophosphate-binding protein n=1 Tax=Winslowiella toletana TaxID=92490 RepID=UPI0028BED27E|nr:thiamine pyrophosphate-binding protein [Winslowiella toletana]WNN45497.1 thiamine pyrophosphate-binding protein [Winslowiella toletana]
MEITVADDLVKFLEGLRVGAAFGVSGGFIVPVWQALSQSEKIRLYHCRHESGGVFAASEYSLCQNQPTVAFATAGPGITNALTGIKAARIDGSQLIFISSITAEAKTGRWCLQETTRQDVETLLQNDGQGYFDSVFVISTMSDYLAAKKEIAAKLREPSGCSIGVFITTTLQKALLEDGGCNIAGGTPPEGISEKALSQVHKLADDMMTQKTLFWVGFGARHAAENLTRIAVKTQSSVISTPRGKGIFPEKHPLYAGATGLGSNGENIAAQLDPRRHPVVVILGSRLSELSSSRAQDQLSDSIIYYIGLNSRDVASNLPPQTIVIECEIDRFLASLSQTLRLKEPTPQQLLPVFTPSPELFTANSEDAERKENALHPRIVMQVLQEIVIEKYDGYLAADAGNSFVWTNRFLKFSRPVRYRTSTGFGAMGHYACGLIGIAASTTHCAVGVIGDGAMLMGNEVSTAVQYKLPAIWLVMNDGCYNMCRQGLDMLGNAPLDCDIPATDFALLGKSLGATGYRVSDKAALKEALIQAISARQTAVIDVIVDRYAVPPLDDRINTLQKL